MGQVGKLYPPIIGNTIPAFYKEPGTDTATISVPFTMNKAVSAEDFDNFVLKIKSVYSNTLKATLETAFSKTYDSETNAWISVGKNSCISEGVVNFSWNINEVIQPGQFVKIQLAYLRDGETTGYFSTPAIVKYTTKPTVYIEGLDDNNFISIYQNTYIGVYECGDDESERPYSYNFQLFDKNKSLVEESGWKLHNSTEDESLINANDSYNFSSSLIENETYYIKYIVRTINNLEISSRLYPCAEIVNAYENIYFYLKAENIFEDGYINLSFVLKDNYIIEDNYICMADEEFLRIYKHSDTDRVKTIVNEKDKTVTKQIIDTDGNILQEQVYKKAIALIEISRSEKADNFTNWKIIKKISILEMQQLFNIPIQDFIIEQGIEYKYSCRLYFDNQVYSKRVESNTVLADFEDMFLYDGNRQLKIRFNPKVSSFKTTKQEQKIDTIGSRYPFIFRNSIVDYKEFPIAGLISYTMDENSLFMKTEDYAYLLPKKSQSQNYSFKYIANEGDQEILINRERESTPTASDFYKYTTTLDFTAYNIQIERFFKLKVLNWLNNGEIKFFKSPVEGNYLVRLMNVSLSPEDKLGRMLHSFSSTAYEMYECTYTNLINLGFYTIEFQRIEGEYIKSVNIYDNILKYLSGSARVKLNDAPIINFFMIEISKNIGPWSGIYIRLNGDKKIFITTEKFILEKHDETLPDVYIDPADYKTLLGKNNVTIADLAEILGDTVFTYGYKVDLQPMESAVIASQNAEIKTMFGTYTHPSQLDLTGNSYQLLQFFMLDFYKKIHKYIYIDNTNHYYLVNPAQRLEEMTNLEQEYTNGLITTTQYEEALSVLNSYAITINDLDYISIYHILDTDEEEIAIRGWQVNQRTGNYEFITFDNIDYTINLIDINEQKTSFTEIPVLDLENNTYKDINFGNGIYLNAAFLAKVPEGSG